MSNSYITKSSPSLFKRHVMVPIVNDIKMSDKRGERKKDSGRASSSSKHDIDYLLNRRVTSSSSTPSTNSPQHGQGVSSPTTHQGQASSSTAQGSSSNTAHYVDASKRKSKERPYECEICKFSFGQRSDRNKHVRTVHLRERPFTCHYCSQTFGEKGNL